MAHLVRFLQATFGCIILLVVPRVFAADIADFNFLLSAKDKTIYEEADIFLKKLGFEDFVAEVNTTLDQATNISDLSNLALAKNKEDLRAFNAVRDMADLMYVILKNGKTSSEFQTQLKLLTALIIQQLKPFPLLTAEPLPLEKVRQIQKLSIAQGLFLKNKFIASRATDRFFEEKLGVLKLYLSLMNFADLDKAKWMKSLDETLTDSLSDPYSIHVRQQNRLFGRALIVTLIKFLRETKNETAENSLKNDLRKNGLYIENYILAYYTVDVGQNDLRATPLKSGDLALEYSHGQEAFFTSLVIQPQSAETKLASKLYRLNNSVFDSYKFFDTKKYYALLDKRDTYRDLSDSEKQIYSDFWSRDYANGFSHVGVAKVHHDELSDIKVAWIWDIYPEKNKIGSVRILSTDGFAHPDSILKIGFLSFDSVKILKSLKAQVLKRGFLKNIWSGYSAFVGKYEDGTFGPAIDKDVRHTWQTKVTAAEVNAWTKLSDDEADVWFQQQALPRVFARLRSYLVSSEAKLFADGLVSAKDMLYCSQMVTLAYLEAINLDLQNSPDRIWEFLKYASDSIKNVLKININDRLVSPNGLVWQNDIFKNLFTAFLDRDGIQTERTQSSPTVAEQYSTEIQNLPELKQIKLDEDSLLILDESAIQLDLET